MYRKMSGEGAKHISRSQRILWKNFQVWVFTKNSSQKNFKKHAKYEKNPKIAIFRDELFGGSSDFNSEIWSKMESLSVLDVFCTDSECNTTLRSNFKKKSIFVIFDFCDCGFGHFDLRNFYQKVNSGSTNHFFTNYHQKTPPEKKMYALTRPILENWPLFVIFHIFHKIQLFHIFICGSA